MDSKIQKPKTRADLTIQDIGDEILVYDSRQENVHILNETAYAIWNMCDGNHTSSAMLDVLTEQFPAATKEELEQDLARTLQEFAEKQLIIA